VPNVSEFGLGVLNLYGSNFGLSYKLDVWPLTHAVTIQPRNKCKFKT